MMLLDVQNLERKEGRQSRVSGVNFTLNRGEILGLLGMNGAGKSTSMKMISGCLAPTRGRVQILEQDLYHGPTEVKRKVGFLPEHPPLYPDMTVDENLDFAASINGLKNTEIPKAREKIKAACGLRDLGRKLTDRLSKGQLQRTGIAQALIHSPELLILDEPTAGLDPIQASDFRSLLLELSEDCGILLSTHLLNDIENLCQRVVILHEGKQLAEHDLRTPGYWSMDVRFNFPQDLHRLKEIEGINEVQEIQAGHYRLELNAMASPQIAEQLAGLGWGMTSCNPAQDPIESLFKALTSGEVNEETGTVAEE